jgi:hypothetical protein
MYFRTTTRAETARLARAVLSRPPQNNWLRQFGMVAESVIIEHPQNRDARD